MDRCGCGELWALRFKFFEELRRKSSRRLREVLCTGFYDVLYGRSEIFIVLLFFISWLSHVARLVHLIVGVSIDCPEFLFLESRLEFFLYALLFFAFLFQQRQGAYDNVDCMYNLQGQLSRNPSVIMETCFWTRWC